jgi:circadian clock protein KaiC
LRFQATRPSFAGLETQLMLMYTAVKSFGPQVVVVDPLNGFLVGDNVDEVKFMLMRLADMLNTSLITGLFTSSGIGDHVNGSHEASISSLIDTWLILEHLEMSGERNRTLSILKARGMPHSNQIREYVLGSSGVHLSDVYIGPRGVLTGSARMTQQAQEQADALLTQNETERLRLAIASKQHALEAKIELLRDELSLQEEQARRIIGLEESKARQLQQDRAAMGIYRTRVAPAAPGAKHEAGPEQP